MLDARAGTSILFALACAACRPAAPIATAIPADDGVAALTLRDLQLGDRACYVVVEKADGSADDLAGDFDLCPGGAHTAAALLGKRIAYTTRPASVLAASCQGDLDCGESDHVDLVVTIAPAP